MLPVMEKLPATRVVRANIANTVAKMGVLVEFVSNKVKWKKR